MHRLASFIICLAIALAASGCGGASSHVGVIKKGLTEMNELYYVYTKVTQKERIFVYVPEVRKIYARMQKTKEQWDSLAPLSKEETKRIKDKYSEPINNIWKRLKSFEANFKTMDKEHGEKLTNPILHLVENDFVKVWTN